MENRVQDFITYVERHTGEKIKRLRSDIGRKHGSKKLHDCVWQQGIIFVKT